MSLPTSVTLSISFPFLCLTPFHICYSSILYISIILSHNHPFPHFRSLPLCHSSFSSPSIILSLFNEYLSRKLQIHIQSISIYLSNLARLIISFHSPLSAQLLLSLSRVTENYKLTSKRNP